MEDEIQMMIHFYNQPYYNVVLPVLITVLWCISFILLLISFIKKKKFIWTIKYLLYITQLIFILRFLSVIQKKEHLLESRQNGFSDETRPTEESESYIEVGRTVGLNCQLLVFVMNSILVNDQIDVRKC